MEKYAFAHLRGKEKSVQGKKGLAGRSNGKELGVERAVLVGGNRREEPLEVVGILKGDGGEIGVEF